ncbi:hypothetical protein F0562_022624 [Nyssa sinensis]|uniref:Uncharacterized protein n=1 Tax=Nyssa sinensis TaxID=561372 RepID=A0A5J5BNH7_9ASTE|nr:hypothetical protein F0562_022624 [Nyssa sinensis]
MQGDALATNTANRPVIRSSASVAGVHSVEGSFGDGVPITCSASAVCTREATSNTNGLEPTIHSLRDIPNAFSDAVRPAANQIGGTPQVLSALNQSFIPPIHPQTPVQSQTPVHQAAFVSHEKLPQSLPHHADSALYATENSRLPLCYSVLQQNTQATPLHTNSSISAVASQANSTCPLAAAPFHMQGDALATNYANRQAFRSSNSAAGVHSVEGSFGDGAPITYSASAVCTRAATSNTNGLEPTVQSTLGLRDLPNAFSDAVRPVANQVGEEIP